MFVHDRLTGQTERVSVDDAGAEGQYDSSHPAISADGAVVAFHSTAALDPVDNNGAWDVYARDRTAGSTERISVGLDGARANSESTYASISADGRYVAFGSLASNLVEGDANGVGDVFVRDRTTGQTTLESVRSDGGQASGRSVTPELSADGRVVVFHSTASNLVPGDANLRGDVFAHDRVTGETTRVSVASDGTESDGGAAFSAVSGDGRYVAFDSSGTALVASDTNGRGDVFVHDRSTGTTTRVSLNASGRQLNDHSGAPAISADGSRVTFTSSATNGAKGDWNYGPDVFVTDWLG